jgi:uncharacterized protein YyaL (SSP411 family)
MKRTVVLSLLLALVIPAGAAAAKTGTRLMNRLGHNPSPYLAMHAGDPVAWQTWDRKAVAAARAQNKLLYVSIGYFSCHWCHVMQRESYRNPEIARYLNAHFVPVKVDRELNPALDARMVAFAERTQGTSGWPMNVFLTPDGYPLYAVLYLPPKEFLSVLKRLQGLWAKDPDGLRKLAHHAQPGGTGPGKPRLDPAQVRRWTAAVIGQARELEDPLSGGFGKQSKFPSVPQLDFLLSFLASHPDPRLEEFLKLTLDQMGQQGLYDHIGGGFFRYTVDPTWQRPHFEKMLYDNALLARLYSRAARQFHSPEYSRRAHATFEFMEKTLQRPNGGMIGALSALDDHNVEGGYYLWSADELHRVLSPAELRVYRKARGMSDAAPFDGGYLPLGISPSIDAKAKELGLTTRQLQTLVDRADGKLLAARQARHVPPDTKQLAGWNGLALSAFAESARHDADPNRRRVAGRIRGFLLARLWDGERLHRAVSHGHGIGQPALEDYAYVVRGLTDWALLTGKPEDTEVATRIADRAWREFYGPHGWRLGESSLIAPETGRDAIEDGPMPSPPATLMGACLDLARLRGDKVLRRRVLAALNSGADLVQQAPFWYASRVRVMQSALYPGDRAGP